MGMVSVEKVGTLGMITDLKPYELDPEAWSGVMNARFTKDGAEKFDGHTEVYPGALHAPYYLFPWPSTVLGFQWLYPGLARIGRINGIAQSDVTRFTTVLGDDDYSATSSSLWFGTLLGDLPVLTYDGVVDLPQAWSTVNGRFEDLPNWPTDHFADIMTVVSDHLVAMRVNEPSGDNPRLVKWSQPADPGTYPSSWDEQDPSTGAGEVTLKETDGPIMTVALLDNQTLIYKTDSVISMRFIGGQNVFKFDTVWGEFGAFSRRSVGILEEGHLVVTETDVLIHNGNTFRSVIDDRNRDLLFDSISETWGFKLNVAVDKLKSEVWINYPDTTSIGQLNRALVWSINDNTWSFRELQDFEFGVYGRVDLSTISRIYDDQGSQPVYNNFVGTYQRQQLLRAYLTIDSVNSKFYHMNQGNLFDTVIPTSFVERSGLGVVGRTRENEWRIDLNSRKFIARLFPKIDSSLPLDIYVGGQEKVDGPVDWVGPFPFDANVDNHIDCMINTRFFAVRFQSDVNMSWSVFGYAFDVEIIGESTI